MCRTDLWISSDRPGQGYLISGPIVWVSRLNIPGMVAIQSSRSTIRDMRTLLAIAFTIVVPTAPLLGQPRPDLFVCEGCEAIFDRSFVGLSWTTRIPPVGEPGVPLTLSGRVTASDGLTPAVGVVLYVYHTSAAGLYPSRGSELNWGRRHGYLRGWVKTAANGEYRIETIRPGGYPGRSDPAHIHITVKEPERQEYWIDDVVFTDDPRLNRAFTTRQGKRGGAGVVTPTRDADGTWKVRRDITLER